MDEGGGGMDEGGSVGGRGWLTTVPVGTEGTTTFCRYTSLL